MDKDLLCELKKAIEKDRDVINAIRALSAYELLNKEKNSVFDIMYKWQKIITPTLYYELSKNNDSFVNAVLENKKDSVLNIELGDIAKNNIIELANLYKKMSEVQKKLKKSIEKIAKKAYPNTSALLGPIMATKFLEKASSLERLAKMPASTLQLIGAEQALFKHLRYGKKSPKYGYLLQHRLMKGLSKRNKGKMARAIANKLKIAINADFFDKKDISKDLLDSLNKKRSELL